MPRNNIDMSEADLLDGLLSGTITMVAVAPSTQPPPAATRRPKIPVADIPWTCRGTQLTIRHDRVLPGEPLSIDFEFQNYGTYEKGFKHRIGCVGIVNTAGEVVLHVYLAYPNELGVKKLYPGRDFMVEAPDFLFQNGAQSARKVEKAIKELVSGRTNIVHDKTHDQSCFFYEGDALKPSNGVTLVDTQVMYSHLALNGRPSLKRAYSAMFNDTIQDGPHNPVEDAQAAFKLQQLEHPYDRVAESAKLTSKSVSNSATRSVAHRPSVALAKPVLGDYVKIKERQGKTKRGKKSAGSLAQSNGMQGTIAATH